MTHRSSKCRSLGLALGGWLAFVSCARAEDAEGTPPAAPGQLEERLLEELAARGAKIGNIEIVVQNVFDTSDPEESKRLYRWANRMHMTTRESVIESILLFEEGDPLEPRLLAESARLLRARDFLVEATVEPSAYHEETNTVDILVVARDGWSLSPEIKIGRNGGENELGLGIEESNLLGTGKGLTVSYSTDVDRDEAFLAYADPNVRGSRAKLDVVLANTSDGDRFSLSAGRPFYALDTRWSVEGLVHDEERVDPIYDLGETVDEFVHLHRTFTIQGGWSRGIRGNDRALRWIGGFTRDEHEFRPAPDTIVPLLLPENRTLAYPWIGFEIVEDDFRVMTELNDIGRTEDVPLGLNVRATLGFSSESFGADRGALLLSFAASKGWEPGPGKLFLLDASASTRRERGLYRNSLVSLGARYYQRNLGHHLFLTSLSATVSGRLDAERQILLGGDNGLRGYPLRYQAGKHRAVLTLEQRFFTDWYPWRLFRVGYAVFLDVGRVWGEDRRATPPLGTLANIGAGLRLTSPRSSSRQVVHIDLATPLTSEDDIDSWQLTVETKRSF
ncbi:MAG: hypothetical protein WBE98_11150 [Gammaproteobacteria bacterium]